MRHRDRQHGFSLIEIMVSLVILSVVMTQVIVVFNSQRRVAIANSRVLDVQESARLLSDLIVYDLRMAGMLVPKVAGVSSSDGGATGPDRLCISDASYFNTPLDGAPSASLDNRAEPFTNAAVTSASGTSVIVVSADIDGEGTAVDFVAGDGIILSDGAKTHCAAIASIAGTQINLQGGHGIPGGLFATIGDVRAVPAVIYEIPANSMTMTRNGLVLSAGVEDLQVEYWVDNQNNDGLQGPSEFPIHDLNANPGGWQIRTDLIRRVRLSVVTRTDSGENSSEMTDQRYRRPASANRSQGADDEFRRRRFVVSITPRNLL